MPLIRVRARYALGAVMGLWFVCPPAGAFAEKVTLRNCMSPELLTVHDLKATWRRSLPRGKVREESAVRLTAQLTRAHFGESHAGQVKVASLLVCEPGTVLSLTRDGKPVEPRPGPQYFNLPLGSAHLHTRVQTLRDGPTEVIRSRAAEEAVMEALLDVAHWPPRAVEVKARWSRGIETLGFSGTQHYELVEATRIGEESVVVVAMSVEGEFAAGLGGRYRLEQGSARLVWARADRVLLRLEGSARYEKRIDGESGPERDTLDVEMGLKNRVTLSEAEQQVLRQSLSAFGEAWAEYQAGRPEKALADCARFRQGWPTSRWLPAVEHLERISLEKSKPAPRMTAEEAQRSLVELVARWQAAEQARDDDLRARTRRAFEQLAEQQEAHLRRMWVDEDENVRSLGIFAGSFTNLPAAFEALIAATRDPSPRVRAWAANGLSARRDPATDPALLRRLLGDVDPQVRARACAAVPWCLPPRQPVSGMLRGRLHELARDADATVRLEAIAALGAAGGAADVAALEAILSNERDARCREAGARALERLRRQ